MEEVVFRRGESRPSLSPDRNSAFSIRCLFRGLSPVTLLKCVVKYRREFTVDVRSFFLEVSVQQQHAAANGGPRRPALSLVHAELPETLQPPQTPQTLTQPLHLQLRGESRLRWRFLQDSQIWDTTWIFMEA